MNPSTRIRALRVSRRLSVQELSARLNWPASKLTKLETGKQKILYNDMEKIAKILEVDILDLIKESFSNSNLVNQGEGFKKLISQIASQYHIEASKKLSENKVAPLIIKEFPKYIQKSAYINSQKYIVKGGMGGKPHIAEIPWVAILRTKITDTPTRGIYIIYLFSADMQKVYLSLNQGVTFLRENLDDLGEGNSVEVLSVAAKVIRSLLGDIPENINLEKIDLKSQRKLAKGYIKGHITGVEYNINNLPDERKFLTDLEEMMDLYKKLELLQGNRSNEQFYEWLLAENNNQLIEEEELSTKIESFIEQAEEEAEQILYSGEPQKKKKTVINNKGVEQYPRDLKVAARAIKKADYLCEYETAHGTFTREKGRVPYREAHHLIPLKYHDQFEYSLDIEENICALCSECHNCLHYGVSKEKEKILYKLFKQRVDCLTKAGICIDFDTLKMYYNIKN